MPIHIYADLQSHMPLKDITKNWKNVTRSEKNQGIIKLIIDMTGFDYDPTVEEVNSDENPEKYKEIVNNMFDSGYERSHCITNHLEAPKIIKRFDLFAQSVVSTFNNTAAGDWLNSVINFTEELIKNEKKFPDLVMIACLVRVIFVKHLSILRSRCEKEEEYMSSHAATMKVLTQACKVLFGSYGVGILFKDIHDMYVDIGLSLFRMFPDFFIIHWNQLEIFGELLRTNCMKTLSEGYETLRFLMEGTEIEDEETREDVRIEIAEYFEINLENLFLDMILHERLNISKEAFQLLNVVQKYRGSNPIIKNQKSLEDVYDAFMHESKTIRPFAMQFMLMTMKRGTLLKYILSRLEKYEAPITEITQSIFECDIFTQWEIYPEFLHHARNKVRSVTVVTEMIKQVLVQLTLDYKKADKGSETSNSKREVLEFLQFYPSFLYIFRARTPHVTRYLKMLGMTKAINFEDLVGTVSEETLQKIKTELIAGLDAFDTYSAINGIMMTFVTLREHFNQYEDDLTTILEHHSQIFVQSVGQPNSVEFKRATYVVYACLAQRKFELVPPENYEELFLEGRKQMLDDDFLGQVMAKGAVLAVWAQILTKCFKIVVERIKETKQDNGMMNLSSVEDTMKLVLSKMQEMMTQTVTTGIVILYSDMQLILLNAGNLLRYLWILKKHQTEPLIYTSTFTCIVTLTEMMLKNTEFHEILSIFNDFYDVHHDILLNHEEISIILRHFGQPRFQKHQKLFTRLLSISHSRDNTTDKTVFRDTIAQTFLLFTCETDITLFWSAFQNFIKSSLKLEPKTYLTFIANLAFVILQKQLRIPRTDDTVNRFEIFEMMPQLVDEIKKSVAVTISVTEVFVAIQQKHEGNFNHDENRSLKNFVKELSKKGGEEMEN